MTVAVGVDARQREGYWTVRVEDGSLDRIEKLDTLDAVLDASSDADAITFDVPIGHEDPEGDGDGRRACERAAAEMLGEAIARERILPMPPHAVYEVDHYHEATRLCQERGWPELPKPMWHARHRVLDVLDAAADDERIVEVHPEVSFTIMNGLHGDGGPLEHYGSGWNAIYERLTLLQAAGLRPAESLGDAGGASPEDVVDATVAAWSAHRVAVDEARTVPDEPPVDPRTGRRVAFYA